MASLRTRGEGIEVEDENADGGIGNDEGDGAGARRDAGEGGANGGGDGFAATHVEFADAGDQDAGTQRLKRVDRRFMLAGQRGGEHALGRKLDCCGRTACVMRWPISIC